MAAQTRQSRHRLTDRLGSGRGLIPSHRDCLKPVSDTDRLPERIPAERGVECGRSCGHCRPLHLIAQPAKWLPLVRPGFVGGQQVCWFGPVVEVTGPLMD
jgi:hypothetical protein